MDFRYDLSLVSLRLSAKIIMTYLCFSGWLRASTIGTPRLNFTQRRLQRSCFLLPHQAHVDLITKKHSLDVFNNAIEVGSDTGGARYNFLTLSARY